MPFLTGLATVTLAPFLTDAKLDAAGAGWTALAALTAAAAILGRAVRRDAHTRRRQRVDARLAALADPRRHWLAPSVAFYAPPRAVPPAAPDVTRNPPAEPEPSVRSATVAGLADEQPEPAAPAPGPDAAPVPEPETAQPPPTAPEPAAQPAAPELAPPDATPSVPETAQQAAEPVAPEPVTPELPPTREQLFVRAMRVPVVLVPLPEHVRRARLAGLLAPPLAAPEAAQAMLISAPEAVQAPPAAPEPVPQELPPPPKTLYTELRAPLVPVPLLRHVQEARLAGLMAPPLPEPEPVRAAPPAAASVPLPGPVRAEPSSTFPGGHVLASGLDTRLFLRYRHWTGVVGDSIFQLYQLRAARPGGPIAQLHGYCFALRACQVIAMQDVRALGDEQTGNFIFDLDAFLLGTPVRPNPFGITLYPRGEFLCDQHAPMHELPAAWLEWRHLSDQQAVHQAPPRPQAAAGAARFLLRYIGSDSRTSDRFVRVTAVLVGADGAPLSVRADCERAGAARTFKRDRIAGLGDPETGALHNDIDRALRLSGAKLRPAAAAAPEAGGAEKAAPGRSDPPALVEARRAFAAMAPAERLASAARPPEPAAPKEKRPRGRPRKNPAPE